MMDYSTQWTALLHDLKSMESVPMSNYCNRLYNKARESSRAKEFQNYLQRRDKFPKDDAHADEQQLDGWNIFTVLGRLADCSLAKAVALVDDKDDTLGLKKSIDPINAKSTDLQLATNLFSFCLAEHISYTAHKRLHRTLHELADLEGFAKYVQKKVKEPMFINDQLMRDPARANNFFSVCVLFVCDYLEQKKTGEPDVWGAEPLPTYDEHYKNSPSFLVVKEWGRYLWEEHGKTDPSMMDKIVEFCGKASSAVFCPTTATGRLEPRPAFDIIKGLHGHLASSSTDKTYIEHVNASISRLEHEKDTINAWEAYCATLQQTWEKNIQSEWVNAVNSGVSKKDQKLKDWVTEGRAWELNRVQKKERIFLSNLSLGVSQGAAMGIVAGTKISLTTGESVAVEMLDANACIKTHEATAVKVGSAFSADKSCKSVSLVAFNGERPFASESQIFYTSTGLRAVNPEAAVLANPLAKVNRLQVGHVLYRLRTGAADAEAAYECQEIHAIDILESSSQDFYSVTAAEFPSYHANGFLLSTNNPQASFNAALESLKQVPASQLMIHLSSMPELAAVFKKHDVKTIHECVARELYGSVAASSGPHSDFTNATFASLEERQKAIQASAWSYSSGIAIKNLELEFILNSQDTANSGYQMPSIQILDGILVVDGHVQHQAVLDPGRRTFRWSRHLPSGLKWAFEHGTLRIFPDATGGCGVIQLSQSSNPNDINKESLYPFQAAVATGPAGTTSVYSSDASGVKPLFEAKLMFDKKVWPAERQQPDNPDWIEGDSINLGLYTSPQKGVEAIAFIPTFDDLRARLNDKFGTKIEDFYMATVDAVENGFKVNIDVNVASAFPFLSDAGEDISNTFNIDFKHSLGVEFKLPMLWQSMEVNINTENAKATGTVYQYDPKMRGLKGHRHSVKGGVRYSASPSQGTGSLRSIISNSLAKAFPSPGASPSEPRTDGKPASITSRLHLYGNPSIEGLAKMDYKSQEIHNAAQNILMQAVHYHMTDKQRELLKLTKPPHLPYDLTEGLSSDVRNFISKEYAPAFIGYMTSTVKGYEKELNEKQQNKIWYWFQGQGDTCMSKRKEYTTLNNLSGVEAVKRLHERDLEPFMKTKTEAKKWAKTLHDHVMAPFQIRTYAYKCSLPGGYVQINKICMLLNVLDDNLNFAEQWFDKVIPAVRHMGLKYPYIGPEEKVDKQFIDDAMKGLILAVLRGDAELTDDVRNGLLQDLQKFERDNKMGEETDLKTRASNLVTKMSVLNAEIAKWLSSVAQVVKKAFHGLKMFGWMSKAFKGALTNVLGKVTDIIGLKGMKGITVLSMGAFYMFQIGVTVLGMYQNWDHMSSADRATSILETLRSLCQGVDNAFDTWKKYTTSEEISEPRDFLQAMELDEQVGKKLETQGKRLEKMGKDLYHDKGLRRAISENLAENRPTAELEKRIVWDEDLKADPVDVPGGGMKAAKKFSIQGSFLRIANAAIGIGVTICMTMSLIREWGNLTTVGKILETCMVIVQFLTVVLDIIELGSVVGLYVVTGAFAVALPIFGAVLAVIGIVLMIISFFLNDKEKSTPPDPVKHFIENEVKPVILHWPDAPANRLTYEIQPSTLRGGAPATLRVKVSNNSGADVKLHSSTVILTAGEDETCTLKNKVFTLSKPDDPKKETAGHVYVDQPGTATGSLNSNRMGSAAEFYKFTLDIFGPEQKDTAGLGELVVKKGHSFTAEWTGTAAKAGKGVVEVVERWTKDTSHKLTWVTRT